MTGRIILCGNGCGHDHEGLNSPTGCCDEHGPYMYFCGPCHDRWVAANPERVARVRGVAHVRNPPGQPTSDGPA